MTTRTRGFIIDVVVNQLNLPLPDRVDHDIRVGVGGLGLDSIYIMHLLSEVATTLGVDLLDEIGEVGELTLGELVARIDARQAA